MSCKWAIPGKLDWQCGINRTLCYGALLFAQFDVKGVSSSRQQDGGLILIKITYFAANLREQ